MKTSRFVGPMAATLLLLACDGGGGSDDAGGGARDGGPPRTDAGDGGGGSGDAQAIDAFVITDPDSGPSCAGTTCNPGQRCDVSTGTPGCVPVTCEELTCAPTERCQPAPSGVGNVCVDVSCTDSLECPAAEYCNGTICVADTCEGGSASCLGVGLSVCADDGSTLALRYSCGSEAYFTSACTSMGTDAFCPCEDDWDCPADTTCEAGRCAGTGQARTCAVPPVPFASVLPSQEIRWGGLSAANNVATGSPFPSSSQVSTTPLVVNLDDDNGDGLVNENDIPEIVFQTYCGTDVSTNGALRAIHGGGANRGRDFFATLGTTVWHEGQPIPTAPACSTGTLDSTAGVAAGDLDGDGLPELVTITENDGIAFYSNRGEPLGGSANSQFAGYADASPAIANLDFAGMPEIIVGRDVFTIARNGDGPFTITGHFAGAINRGSNGQGPISCIANIAGDERPEVIAGTTAYAMPTAPMGIANQGACPPANTTNFCRGILDVVWDGQMVNGNQMLPNGNRDGFCAVADVLGTNQATPPSPTNALDGLPEVIVVSDGHLLILTGATGRLQRNIDLMAGTNGGAPNVDDFDGDGFPEIGTAFGTRYIAYDLQATTAACPAWPTAFRDGVAGLQGNPARAPGGACSSSAECAAGATCGAAGTCVCLHNGWQRVTEDDSSRVTASTVFDFNGDGAAEVTYNDECYFRIYDGRSGDVLFRELNSSRTRTENPVVADVDNDGNAEIVFCANNDASACSAGTSNNGIEVWGDASDTWVSARRIWNEHAYHVTNILESGGVPTHEPEHWRSYSGRSYNTYRSQPRAFGAAPDLTVARVQTSSPDAACGTLSSLLDIAVRVRNQGDLRVGPDVRLTFYGEWDAGSIDEPLYADTAMTPLRVRLGTTLEARDEFVVTASYAAANNGHGALPDRIRVVVDEAMSERECVETNNSATVPVVGGTPAADLGATIGTITGGCPSRTVPVTVTNEGSAPASNVLVRLFAGDPRAGGSPLVDATIAGPIAAGGNEVVNVVVDPFPTSEVVIYAVIDPLDTVMECNDGNNIVASSERLSCGPI